MSPNCRTEFELTSYAEQPTAAASGDIEPLHDQSHDSDEGFSLPPTDGGKDAWLCLSACFMLEALLWGKLEKRVQETTAHRRHRLSVFLWYLPGIL